MFDEETDLVNAPQKEISAQSTTMINMLLMFLFLWQKTFYVSDVGIDALLKFISLFVLTLSKIFPMKLFQDFALHLPKSAIAGRKILGTNADDFAKLACCRACSSIYLVDVCKVKLPGGQFVSKKC